MTTRTADPDVYVDTCLSRSLEALGVEEASEVIGTPIPIEFEEASPVTVRISISRAVLVVSTPQKDHRLPFARLACAMCAVVAVVSAGVALSKSPLRATAKQVMRIASVDLARR